MSETVLDSYRHHILPCPECSSKNVTIMKFGAVQYRKCEDCLHTWKTSSNDWKKKRGIR